jgi:hypothetical protein
MVCGKKRVHRFLPTHDLMKNCLTIIILYSCRISQWLFESLLLQIQGTSFVDLRNSEITINFIQDGEDFADILSIDHARAAGYETKRRLT